MIFDTWIKWAFEPSDTPHRFPSFVLARQAGRDLEREVTVAEFEAAIPYPVDHRNARGSAYYLMSDTLEKRRYDFRTFVLADPIDHPLSKPDPQAAFHALPADQQAAILQWIMASLRVIRRTRTVGELRYPCQVVTRLPIRDEHMRGALLTAGIEPVGDVRFRCCLSDKALAEFLRARREQQEKQP